MSQKSTLVGTCFLTETPKPEDYWTLTFSDGYDDALAACADPGYTHDYYRCTAPLAVGETEYSKGWAMGCAAFDHIHEVHDGGECDCG